MNQPARQFRIVAIAEAISYLVLLGIAMPLKYLMHFDLAVRVVGWIHGVLFVLYMLTLVRAAHAGKWSALNVFLAVAASFLPFGPFFLEPSNLTDKGTDVN